MMIFSSVGIYIQFHFLSIFPGNKTTLRDEARKFFATRWEMGIGYVGAKNQIDMHPNIFMLHPHL